MGQRLNKRPRLTARNNMLELLEQRRLLASDLAGVTPGLVSNDQLHHRVPTSEIIALVPEEYQHAIPAELLEADEVIVIPTVSAGAASGSPPDTPQDRIDPNVGGRFGGVPSIEVRQPNGGGAICSGVVIAPTFVLTAGHCFDQLDPIDGQLDPGVTATVHLNNGGDLTSSHAAANITSHPDFAGAPIGGPSADLTVIELATPVPSDTPIYPIHDGGIGLGEVIEFVGYGVSGSGDVGFTINPTLSAKRVGKNAVTLLVAGAAGVEGAAGEIDRFLFDFDADDGATGFEPPTGAADVSLGNDVESTIGQGDSGGPVFIEIDGEPVLAGLSTFLWALPNITEDAGFFGSLAGGLVLKPYVPFINEFIAVDLQVDVTESSERVTAGGGIGNLVHEVTISNSGPNNATSVVVEDLITVPDGVTIDSVVPSSGTFSGSNWNIPSVAAGGSETLTVTMTVGSSTVGGRDLIASSASIVSRAEPDTDSSNDSDAEATSVSFVDIAVSQTETIDPIGFGASNLTYSIVAENLGTETATNVVVSEVLDLPGGVTLDFVVPQNGSFANNLWTIGALAPGEVAELDVILSVTPAAVEAVDAIRSTATLNSVFPSDSNSLNNTSVETTTIQDNGIDIAITQTQSSLTAVKDRPGETLTFEVHVKNLGNGSANSVLIDNVIEVPDGVTVESIEVSDGLVLGGMAWVLNGVDGGEEQILTVTLSFDSSAPLGTDLISNTASLSFIGNIDVDSSNNSSTATASIVSGVDIELTQAESIDPVVAGSEPDNLVYTVTATNKGVVDASGVAVDTSLVLPTGVTVSSVVPSVGTYSGSTWTVGDLAVGNSETLTVTLTADASAAEAPDSISSTVMLSSMSEVDDDPSNDSSTITTSIAIPDVNIALEIIESTGTVEAGTGEGNLVYTILASNSGPQTATDIAIETLFDLPAGTFVSSTGSSAGTYVFQPQTSSDLLATWTVPLLGPGATDALAIELTVPAITLPGTDVVGMTASVVGQNEVDATPTNDVVTVRSSVSAPDVEVVTETVDIALSQTVSSDPIVAGSNVVYTIAAENLADEAATGVLINTTLDLPTGATVISAVPSSGTYAPSNWNIFSLAPGTTETLAVTVAVPAITPNGETVTSSATLAAVLEEDTNASNNSVTDTSFITSTGEPPTVDSDIGIAIAESTDPVVAGSGVGNLVYTITATNEGVTSLTGATIATDFDLPVGVTIDSVVPSPGFFIAPNWNIIQLLPDASATLTVTLTVDDSVAAGTDVITGSVSLSDLFGDDQNAANNVAAVATSVTQDASPVATVPSTLGIRGTAWELDAFEISPGANDPLPWSGMDTIEIGFAEQQSAEPVITLLGPDASSDPISVTLESWDGANAVASFAELDFGYYKLVVNEQVYDFSVAIGGGARTGSIGFADFALLARTFGSETDDLLTSDYDANGRVGFSDFALLARNFGATLGSLVPPVPPAVDATQAPTATDQIFAMEDDDDKAIDLF